MVRAICWNIKASNWVDTFLKLCQRFYIEYCGYKNKVIIFIPVIHVNFHFISYYIYINIRDLYRGINDIKKGYKPRTNAVKHEKGDLVADSYSIVARCRIYFSQLLNVHGVNDIKHTVIHTAEPLVPELSAFEVELDIEKLKSHKSTGTDQIPGELIKAGGRKIRYQIHKLIISIWNE